MFEAYLPVFLMLAIAIAIPVLLYVLASSLGPKDPPNPEFLIPYESGSESTGAKHVKLSVKFYLTAILFVVFDIEVVFMYPWAALFKGLGWNGFATMFGFIVALIVGLAYCWKKGALEWEN